MEQVQKIAFEKALRVLDAVKDKIAYAVEYEGKTYGNRALAPVKSRGTGRYPHGMTRKHYLPYFKGAQIGDVIKVPFADFEPRVLAANISAACFHMYGKGNVTVHLNRKSKCIEVMIEGMHESGQLNMFDDDEGCEDYED